MHYQRVLNTGCFEKRVFNEICSVNGCLGLHKAKGLCIKHYTRMIRGGTLNTSRVVGNDEKRMIANSKESSSGCIEWVKFKKLGYGVAGFNGRIEQAHRVAWIIKNGPIPKGMQINHICHNRACIKIDHLYLGTQKENMRDMDMSGRRNKTFGINNGMAKLNNDLVKLIRKDKRTNAAIAKDFSVSKSLISAVRRFLIWTHV
jgi:hypothetical protein